MTKPKINLDLDEIEAWWDTQSRNNIDWAQWDENLYSVIARVRELEDWQRRAAAMLPHDYIDVCKMDCRACALLKEIQDD